MMMMKRELYAIFTPNFQDNLHLESDIIIRCYILARPGGPHSSARSIRIVSTQRTVQRYETSLYRASMKTKPQRSFKQDCETSDGHQTTKPSTCSVPSVWNLIPGASLSPDAAVIGEISAT